MSRKLTDRTDAPFELCFKYPLIKGFTFRELTKQNNKELQGFLDKVAKLSANDVDRLYARKPDKNDKYNKQQVYHYAVTDSFRIHVIIEEGMYKVIRLDPNHRKHC